MGLSRPTIYLEGGGQTAAQKARYRIGFATMLASCGAKPQVVPCGPRNAAHEKFVGHQGASVPILLVDSEDPVPEDRSAKDHLSARDGWVWPSAVKTDQVHLMATSMETWLACDPEGLRTYFGPVFDVTKLIQRTDIESAPKQSVLQSLERASAGARDGGYTKHVGRAAPVIAALSPEKIRTRAQRFGRPFFDCVCPQVGDE